MPGRKPMLLCVFLIFALLILPQASATLSISDIPQCPMQCLLETIPHSGCALYDIECQCASRELAIDAYACLIAECSIADTLQFGRVQADLCHIDSTENKGPTLLLVTLLFACAMVLIVSLRFWSRYNARARVRLDDWIILAAAVLLIPQAAMTVWCAKHGLGMHVWRLDPATISRIYLIYFVGETLYLAGMGLTQVSILVFYLHLFPGERTRLIAKILLGTVVASTIISIGVQLGQCSPISFAWDKDVGHKEGTCVDLNKLAYGIAGINTGQHVLILILPLPSLLRLNVRLFRKICLVALFGLGSFACATSIARICYIKTYGAYIIDITWDTLPGTIWAEIDVYTTVIASCLPFLPSVLKQVAVEVSTVTSRLYSPERLSPTFRTTSQSTGRRRSSAKVASPAFSLPLQFPPSLGRNNSRRAVYSSYLNHDPLYDQTQHYNRNHRNGGHGSNSYRTRGGKVGRAVGNPSDFNSTINGSTTTAEESRQDRDRDLGFDTTRCFVGPMIPDRAVRRHRVWPGGRGLHQARTQASTATTRGSSCSDDDHALDPDLDIDLLSLDLGSDLHWDDEQEGRLNRKGSGAGFSAGGRNLSLAATEKSWYESDSTTGTNGGNDGATTSKSGGGGSSSSSSRRIAPPFASQHQHRHQHQQPPMPPPSFFSQSATTGGTGPLSSAGAETETETETVIGSGDVTSANATRTHSRAGQENPLIVDEKLVVDAYESGSEHSRKSSPRGYDGNLVQGESGLTTQADLGVAVEAGAQPDSVERSGHAADIVEEASEDFGGDGDNDDNDDDGDDDGDDDDDDDDERVYSLLEILRA